MEIIARARDMQQQHLVESDGNKFVDENKTEK